MYFHQMRCFEADCTFHKLQSLYFSPQVQWDKCEGFEVRSQGGRVSEMRFLAVAPCFCGCVRTLRTFEKIFMK